MAMWSDVSLRILDMGSTTSPAHGVAAGPCESAGAWGAPGTAPENAGAAPAAGRDERYASRSLRVTRPAMPLPVMAASSTPCSAAILRTSGDDLVRTRSSNEPAGAEFL